MKKRIIKMSLGMIFGIWCMLCTDPVFALETWKEVITSQIECLATDIDNVYFVRDGSIVCIAKDTQMIVWTQAAKAIHYLFRADNEVVAINEDEGIIYQVNSNGMNSIGSYNPKDLEETSYDVSCRWKCVALIDNRLYFVGITNSEDNIAISYDMKKKEIHQLPWSGVWGIINSGKDGLLIYQYIEDTQQYCLSINDHGKNKLKTIYESVFPLTNVIVDSENENIYVITVSEIVKLQKNGKTEHVAWKNEEWDYEMENVFCATMLNETEWVTYGRGRDATFHVLNESEKDSVVLYIAGGIKDAAYEQYCKEHDDVQVMTDIPNITAQQMKFYIDTNTSDVDIFILDICAGYRYVREKNYWVSLDESTVIKEEIKRYYPQIQEVLTFNGHILAVPAYFSLDCFTINETLWNEILPQETIPTTYEELINFMQRWTDEYQEQYPNILPVEFGGSSIELLKEFTRQYIFQCENAGELSFDTEEFRQIIRKSLALDLKRVTTEAEEEEYNAKQKLITLFPWNQYGIIYDEGDKIVPICPFAAFANQERLVPARMQVYVINPNTRHIKEAIEYLETVVLHLSAQTSAGIIEGWEIPVLSNSGKRALEQIDSQIHEKEEELKKAEPAEQKSIQAQIDMLTQRRIEREKTAYDVSSESIQLYQALIKGLCIPLQSPFYEEESDAMKTLMEVLERLYQGKISLEECIKEMERKRWMILGEEVH